MSHNDELFEIVRRSFQGAEKEPSAARWESCARVAGIASIRLGIDGDMFSAAALEGVSLEARRRVLAMAFVQQSDMGQSLNGLAGKSVRAKHE